MEMHEIRYFIAMCDTLNFRRAAMRCNISQPALTKGIQKLEEKLGGQLFRRERNLTHLTDFGRLIRPYLEEIQSRTTAAKTAAHDFLYLEKAPLNIGIMVTIGPLRFTRFLSEFQRDHPASSCGCTRARWSELSKAHVRHSTWLVMACPANSGRFDAINLYAERYVAIFPRGHRRSGQPRALQRPRARALHRPPELRGAVADPEAVGGAAGRTRLRPPQPSRRLGAGPGAGRLRHRGDAGISISAIGLKSRIVPNRR
jgi:DNA-binding transcriptional LysR family regulator